MKEDVDGVADVSDGDDAIFDDEDLPKRDKTLQVLNSLPWEYLTGLADEGDESNHQLRQQSSR